MIIKKIINRLLKHWQVTSIQMADKSIYLTFDDGPEPGITEFVLQELNKYGFKATFFCRGDNAEKYPQLIERLRKDGHAIGNHTYSHIHAYLYSAKDYVSDVERANKVLRTTFFRPPHGSLTFSSWLKIRKKYKFYYWSIGSGDWECDDFNYENNFYNLCTGTKPGAIVLFHFCNKHENETKKLLPAYLEWLNTNGYKCKAIE